MSDAVPSSATMMKAEGPPKKQAKTGAPRAATPKAPKAARATSAGAKKKAAPAPVSIPPNGLNTKPSPQPSAGPPTYSAPGAPNAPPNAPAPMAGNVSMQRPAYAGMPPAQAPTGPHAMGPNAPDPNVRRSIMHALFMRYKQLHGSNADDATLQRMAANLEREIFQRAPTRDEYAQVAAAEIKRLDVSQQMYGTPPQGREMGSGGATPIGQPQRPPAPYGAPSPGGMMDYRSTSSGTYVPPNTLSYQEFCARMQYQPIQKLVDIMWSQRTMIYDLQQELCHYKKQLQPPQSAPMYPPSYPPQQRPYHPSPTTNGESTPTTATNYDRRPPPTPPQNATAYWAKVAELKDAHSNHLKKAYQILCMASQSTASMQSTKAESMKQNIHYAMVVLNETQETAAQPRDFSVIMSVEAFIRESILPLIRKVQEVSQHKAGTPTQASGPPQGLPPQQQQQQQQQHQQQQHQHQQQHQQPHQQQQSLQQSLQPPPQQQQQQPRGPPAQGKAPDRGQFTKHLLDDKKPSAKENTTNNMDDFADFTGLDDLDDLDEKDDASSFNAKKRPLSEL